MARHEQWSRAAGMLEVIGWFQIVGCTLNLIVYAFVMTRLDDLVAKYEEPLKIYFNYKNSRIFLEIMAGVGITILVLGVLVGVLLLIGVKRRKSSFLLIWTMYTAIAMGIDISSLTAAGIFMWMSTINIPILVQFSCWIFFRLMSIFVEFGYRKDLWESAGSFMRLNVDVDEPTFIQQ